MSESTGRGGWSAGGPGSARTMAAPPAMAASLARGTGPSRTYARPAGPRTPLRANSSTSWSTLASSPARAPAVLLPGGGHDEGQDLRLVAELVVPARRSDMRPGAQLGAEQHLPAAARIGGPQAGHPLGRL